MKIYTMINRATGPKVISQLISKSVVKSGSGHDLNNFGIPNYSSALGFGHRGNNGISEATGDFYEANGHAKVSNAEFVRLIAKELPKTKPVPLAKMTRAQLLKVIDDNQCDFKRIADEYIANEKCQEETISVLEKEAKELNALNDECGFNMIKAAAEISDLNGRISDAESDFVREKHRAESVESELSNLKKNIMLLSGVAMGVNV